jgi:hypothetical protein
VECCHRCRELCRVDSKCARSVPQNPAVTPNGEGTHVRIVPLTSRTKIFHFGETENRLKELRESQRRWTAKSLVTVEEYWRQSVLDAPDAVILVTHSKM